jgi:hypothetical protein
VPISDGPGLDVGSGWGKREGRRRGPDSRPHLGPGQREEAGRQERAAAALVARRGGAGSLGRGARGGEGGGGGRELREGPIYRGVRRWRGWPRRWPVRSAINGASAACLRRDATCGEGVGVEASSGTWGRGCASTGRWCERRGRIAAAAGGTAVRELESACAGKAGSRDARGRVCEKRGGVVREPEAGQRSRVVLGSRGRGEEKGGEGRREKGKRKGRERNGKRKG